MDHKIYAFVAVCHRAQYCIGQADLCEKGYTLKSEHGLFESYEAASKKADELNEALGLSVENACKIIGTTMKFESPFEKIVKRLAEFIPHQRGGKWPTLDEAGLIEWLCDDGGIEEIREALKP